MHELRERAYRLRLGGYYDHEIVSILAVEYALDEFQTEDIALLVPKWRHAA